MAGSVHSVEGMMIRCGEHYAKVKDGICMECKRKVEIINVINGFPSPADKGKKCSQ